MRSIRKSPIVKTAGINAVKTKIQICLVSSLLITFGSIANEDGLNVQGFVGDNPSKVAISQSDTLLTTFNDDPDLDGIASPHDNCPTVSNSEQWDKDKDGIGNLCDDDIDGDGFSNIEERLAGSKIWDRFSLPETATDWDGDGINDRVDNCITIANTAQWDNDEDGIGNKCDQDIDGDGYSNSFEKQAGFSLWLATEYPDGQDDFDGDGVSDKDDLCPTVASSVHWDKDKDGIGNRCDDDIDGDGYSNLLEKAASTKPWDASDHPSGKDDSDRDGVKNQFDNCPDFANSSQWDKDNDGVGNECDDDIDGDGFHNYEERQANTKVWDVSSYPSLAEVSVVDGHLVAASGAFKDHKLYTFESDLSHQSSCIGICERTWPPLIARDGVANGIDDLSTLERTDGRFQVTYKGQALYLYSGDQSSADNNGHGLDEQWYLIQIQPELETFVLSSTYHQDVQASYPDVNWQTLDRLYIPAGRYSSFWLGNLPIREADRPLVITNFGGQVHLDDSATSKFVLSGGKNWIVTGEYNESEQTGHIDYQGHAHGQYDTAQNKYGIMVKQGFNAGSGVQVGGKASHFEMAFMEISQVGFAGILVKTDNEPNALMDHVKIHDLYIHDTEAECMYIGNTSKNADSQHKLTNLKIYNNRAIRCGAEALQLSHISDGTHVYNNVFLAAAIDWKDPFMAYQEGNAQIAIRDGDILIENNFFIGGVDSMMSLRPLGSDREIYSDENGLTVKNNYFSHGRGTRFSYIHSDGPISNSTTGEIYYTGYKNNASFRLVDNYFADVINQTDELYSNKLGEDYFFQTKFNTRNRFIFEDNTFAGPRVPYSTADEINGEFANIVSIGNERDTIATPVFMDSGFASDFDYRQLERWADCNEAFALKPNNLVLQVKDDFIPEITYQEGDYVMHHGELYKLNTVALPSSQCHFKYWNPCLDSDPHSYPITRDLPETYQVGDIVDTADEKHYQLISEHEPYSCTSQTRFRNPHPRQDSAWQRVYINASPESPEGEKYWTKQTLPIDDVRLSPSSPIKGIGLLDN